MMDTDEAAGWDPADAAEQYAALGWCVLPIRPGKKHPPIDGWRDAATDDLDTIRSWWGGLYRGHGVGIVTGPRSGFWVLDIDISNGKPGDESLTALVDQHGPLPATVEAETGSGGGHLLFRWDPTRPITNGMSTRLPPGLDIRGDGGQIVAAPTIHPNGRPYQWIEGRGPWDIEVADAPEWLYQLLLAPTAAAPPPVADRPRISAETGQGPAGPAGGPPPPAETGPADWLRESFDWPAELELAGWVHHSTHPGGQSWWTRPGKAIRDGHSAVLHGDGAGPLVVFSTEAGAHLWSAGTATTDGSGVSLTPLEFVAGTRFAGDIHAAARWARAEHRPLATSPPAPISAPVAPIGTDPANPWELFGVWAPADLTTYLAPGWEPEPPSLLERTDGRGLFYRANVNWLHGASGEGKTWVALIAAAQELLAGRHVLWIHYEDPLPDKLANRLRLLGVPTTDIIDRFHVCCIGGASLLDGIPFVRPIADHYDADLVVVDSIGEAIGSDGVAVKDDERFVPWLHQTARVLAGDGRTFLGIDHLPMGEPGRLDPVGSFRKKAAVTGSMFLAESPKPPTQGRAGYIKLTCAKDRSGVWTKGEVAAIVNMGPAGDGIEWSVSVPRLEAAEAGEPESIVLGRHAFRAVKREGRPLSQAALLSAMTEVHGRTEAKRRGIDFAVLRGWLVEAQGPRGARMFDLGPTDPESPADLLEGWEDPR